MEKKQSTCNTCKEKTTKIGHLCDPKIVTKKANLYICQDCGLITTDKSLLCKPNLLRVK